MKKVFVSGTFNVLHPGHLRLLRFARECGDHLIVAIQSDRIAGNGSHVFEQLRLESIKSITWVNEAFIYDEPINSLIERVKPNIVVKGKEHELRFNPELESLEELGGELIFSSGETTFSSLDLIQKEFNTLNFHSINLPYEYMNRHKVTPQRLIELLKDFSRLKLCVVGDLIIDEYVTCEPLGMSQEDPTIVVTPIDYKKFVGGAGIVAAHASGLGAKVHFFSITGNDVLTNYASDQLAASGVDAHLQVDNSRPTTLKQRFRSNGKSLLRVSHLHQTAISTSLQTQLFNSLNLIMEDIDLLVFSDFNYGCLPQSFVDQIIQKSKDYNFILAADSQSSSQIGDISRFKDMDLITPTEREARISTRNNEDGLVVLAEQLRKQANAKNILLKLGAEGLLVHANNSKNKDWLTDRIGAMNNSVKDVAGAGDSLLITSAMTIACGGNIWEAACLGSLAAAIQVGRVGNIPLKIDELIKEIT